MDGNQTLTGTISPPFPEFESNLWFQEEEELSRQLITRNTPGEIVKRRSILRLGNVHHKHQVRALASGSGNGALLAE